jgi:diguanylate cyclase (GGDEF)-like protein
LDIDNFKTINDTYGHHGGDTALVRIADILRGKTRQSDFSARFGGEEFVLVLPETDQESAFQVATKVHDEIKLCAFGKPDHTFTLTVSIGVSSTSEKSYSDWRQMLDNADQALYLAKNRGKDRVETWVAENKSDANVPSAHP